MTIQFNTDGKNHAKGMTVTMNNIEGLMFMKLLGYYKAFRNIIHPEDYKILAKMYTNAKDEVKMLINKGENL